MDAVEFIESVRDSYLQRYRATIRRLRAENPTCTPEVWVQPNPPASDESPREPLCCDVYCGGDKPGIHAVMDVDTPEGARVASISVAGRDVQVYPFAWELCIVWARGADADAAPLRDWRQRWLDPNRSADPADEDGLSGTAHYLAAPVPEGAGLLWEVDLGSAPVQALTELLDALVAAGATELEVGRPDGSDLPPDVLEQIRSNDLEPQRLTEIVAALLSVLPEVAAADVTGPEEIDLRAVETDHPCKVFVTNLYLRLQRVGVEARAKEVWRFVRGQREAMYDRGAPDLSQLRPVIKDDRFLEQMKVLTEGKGTVVSRRLVADLWVCCVWDTPNGMQFVQDHEPANYGLSAEQVHERALANFLASRPEVELAEDGAILVARTGDCYDATLLLDDRFWPEAARRVRGELLVCTPARDVVLIAGTEPRGAVRAMRRAAQRVSAGGDHLVSETILRRTPNGWEPFQPEPTPGAAPQREPGARRPWWKFW